MYILKCMSSLKEKKTVQKLLKLTSGENSSLKSKVNMCSLVIFIV